MIVLRLGSCIDIMESMEADSIDAIVCDPPYGLEFMGKTWDNLDIRQPGDPTYHKSGVGPFDRAKVRYSNAPSYGGNVSSEMQLWHEEWLEEAYRVLKPGNKIKAFGGTRTFHRLAIAMEKVGFESIGLEAFVYGSGFPKSHNVANDIDKRFGCLSRATTQQIRTTYKARTPQGKTWEGWGTALKPAWEPILVGVKKKS